jgi:hypothetical protein
LYLALYSRASRRDWVRKLKIIMQLKEQFEKILLQYLKDTKRELEEKGYIATLDIAIQELEEKIAKDLAEQNHGKIPF